MELEELNPTMVSITVNKTASQDLAPFSFGQRTVRYYELERIGSSYGTIILEGKHHRLSENDVFLRKPGQSVEGIMPYRFQYLTFQTGENGDVRTFLDSLPDKINARGNPQIQVMFDEIQRLYLGGRPADSLLIKAHILELLYLFAEQAAAGYTRHIRAAIGFIEENYFREIGAADIARQAGISVRYLFRQFKEGLADTPVGYLNRLRLEKSKSLLLDTDLSITEIASRCGFCSISYYDYAFRQREGISPSDFRKRYVLSK